MLISPGRPLYRSGLLHRQCPLFIPHGPLHQRGYHYGTKLATSGGKRGVAASALKPLTSISQKTSEPRYLRNVPTASLLNSLLVLAVAVLPPRLLSFTIRWTKKHAHSLEHNGTLRWLFKRTFYNNFCVGAESREITENLGRLRHMGMTGVVLGFAREARDSSDAVSVLAGDDSQLREWTDMNKSTVRKLQPGDFVGIRCTGAGTSSIDCMSRFSANCASESDANASPVMDRQLDQFYQSMRQVCALAVSKGVRVLIDAESTQTQKAIDHVALKLMTEFNTQHRVFIFNTYQLYFKTTLRRIIDHLDHGARNNYTSGIKLVRGAFIHTEPQRTLIHSSKEDTDAAYDAAVAYLLDGPTKTSPKANEIAQADNSISSTSSKPWRAELVLATHNSASVQKALNQCSQDHPSLFRATTSASPKKTTSGVQGVFFAQLMGMADEVSLMLATQIRKASEERISATIPRIGVYKYSVWGTLGECLLYLLRRAEENQDAMKRSKETAKAISRELLRRTGLFS